MRIPKTKSSTSSHPAATLPIISYLITNRPLGPKTLGQIPTITLYSLVIYSCHDGMIGFGSGLKHFFDRSGQAVAGILDPAEPDPQRYAILTVLPQFLALASSRLVGLGPPRRAPRIVKSERRRATGDDNHGSAERCRLGLGSGALRTEN